MASSSEIDSVLSILKREIACQAIELDLRAFQEFHYPSSKVTSARSKLSVAGKVGEVVVTTSSRKRQKVKFVYCKEFPKYKIKAIIRKKKQLLAKHYDMSRLIGRHGEELVASVCKGLGYKEIETNKTKHGSILLGYIGLRKRHIDVWARHPSDEYYQNIEVKNKREWVDLSEIAKILDTTITANSKWKKLKIPIKPALVAGFVDPIAYNDAISNCDLPIALTETVYVPEEHRSFYEEMRSKLAMNVTITDKPNETLRRQIVKYVRGHRYS